jgi:hypothetical protein
MSLPNPQATATAAPEKYLIAFVIQGEDVFKITADNIIHTTGTANGPAFDAIAKLKAAAALLELTNRHKERPDELRQMARELASEGMKLMARASSAIRPVPQPAAPLEATAEAVSEPLAQQETAFRDEVSGTEDQQQETLEAPQPISVAKIEERIEPERVVSERVVLERSSGPVPVPAPVPKPRQQEDEDELSGDSPSNAKIALISL